MISKLTCIEDYICFFKGEYFDLKPITLLVGDQGCGKSTLLSALHGLAQNKNENCFKLEKSGKIKDCVYLDLESGNPAIQQGNPNDSNDMISKMLSRLESHGETLLPILQYLENFSDKIILIDEPETALSLRSQYKMIEIFKECLERNCQVIIATHNLEFIKEFPDNILSLEHMRYVTPDEFIKLEKEPNDFKKIRKDKWIKKYNCRKGLDCECERVYDNKCIHYVDREGKSGYDRRGSGIDSKMKKGDFKNG